jgi:hypothetical protein
MKKMAVAVLFGLALVSTTAVADQAKGKRVYQKFMKDDCGKTGGVVAGKHTQKEWKKITDSGKLQAELTKICPASKSFLQSEKYKKLQGHLGDFMYEFGKGSGNIPAC